VIHHNESPDLNIKNVSYRDCVFNKKCSQLDVKENPSLLYAAVRKYGKIFKCQSRIILLSEIREFLK
jgi:hypothetical protein